MFSYKDLPEVIQLHILSFCDVPTLGSLVPVSKKFNQLAKKDYVWESHLKLLLRELFDHGVKFFSARHVVGRPVVDASDFFHPDPATPPSERPDWRQSTALLRWYWEPRDDFDPASMYYWASFEKETVACIFDAAKYRGPEEAGEQFSFLYQDVPLYEYYHRAGNLAFHRLVQGRQQTGNQYCRDCAAKTFELPKEFRNLPKICFCL